MDSDTQEQALRLNKAREDREAYIKMNWPEMVELCGQEIALIEKKLAEKALAERPPKSPGPEATSEPGPIPRKDIEIDSFEIGTPGKTGVIKIYYDSSQTSKEEMERRIVNATNYLTITKGLLKTE
jgi:hypothetical protein